MLGVSAPLCSTHTRKQSSSSDGRHVFSVAVEISNPAQTELCTWHCSCERYSRPLSLRVYTSLEGTYDTTLH